jgi:5'-methylthioadenosine phosphorylase
VNMDGPAFSTRAESEYHRKMGFDVIGMTSAPEAKLAREAEISLASICFVTDYDCWKAEDEPVSAQTVIGHLLANADAARKIVPKVIEKIPLEPTWPEHTALDFALVTDRKLWPEATVRNLEIILKRFL